MKRQTRRKRAELDLDGRALEIAQRRNSKQLNWRRKRNHFKKSLHGK